MSNPLVRKLQGLADLTVDEVQALIRATTDPQSIKPRKDLIRDGDAAGPTFVMLAGWAFSYKVLPSGCRQIMTFLMPGDACDLRGDHRAVVDHGVQTATDAVVAVISRPSMDELTTSHPGILNALYMAQLADQAGLRSWIISMGRNSSVERLSHFILELFIRIRKSGTTEVDAVELPLSQALLANALGMTPVHINRMLQELRRAGAIELRRGGLRIVDAGSLVQAAGYDASYLRKRLA